METLEGKIAAVTGGTRGIGRAIAERLVREGARVAICGKNPAGVERAVREMGERCAGTAADVARPEEVSKFFRLIDERFKTLDILVNNAGVGVFRSVRETTIEEWHRQIDTNLNGAFYCSREALQRFETSRGGDIINISSLAGKNPFAGGAAYNASKFGMNGFSEAMMLDHRYDNIRVSYIMPGSVSSEFGTGGADWKIAPEDVAEVVVLLLRMPVRTTVSRVEMRPSKPKKS